MESKYNELEKLNELKANGTITDAEFEMQKQKILNNKFNVTKTKRNKSKLFFILAIIFIVITVISIGLTIYYNKIFNDIATSNEEYEATLNFYRTGNSKQIDRIYDQASQMENLSNIFLIVSFCIGGVSVVFVIVGIILKIKEKGGIEIVN